MSYFKAKMHQIRFRLGLCPRPRWGAYSAPPNRLAGFKWPTSKGRKDAKEGAGRRKGKSRGRKGRLGGRGGKWKGRGRVASRLLGDGRPWSKVACPQPNCSSASMSWELGTRVNYKAIGKPILRASTIPTFFFWRNLNTVMLTALLTLTNRPIEGCSANQATKTWNDVNKEQQLQFTRV